MDYLELPIQTQRLRVRRFVEADRAAFLEFMLDPDCTRLLMFPDERHMPRGEADRIYMEDRIADFFARSLGSTSSATG